MSDRIPGGNAITTITFSSDAPPEIATGPSDREIIAALVEALDTIFSRVSYINIHGVGEQPGPDPDGNPQPMRVPVETFHYIWKEIGDTAAAALKLAGA